MYEGEDVEFINTLGGLDDNPLKSLAKSLLLLADADRAVFSESWERSRVCRIEHLCAEEYGIKTLYE
jgi:hypothetical protein